MSDIRHFTRTVHPQPERNRDMTGREIERLLRRPPADLLAQCVPGMTCSAYEPERLYQLRRYRGLERMEIGGVGYLLPCDCWPIVQEIVQTQGRGGDALVSACALYDRLTERNIPVPPYVLALLGRASGRDRQSTVDRMVSDPATRALSNREIARRCGCSEGYVRQRRQVVPSAHGYADTQPIIAPGAVAPTSCVAARTPRRRPPATAPTRPQPDTHTAGCGKLNAAG